MNCHYVYSIEIMLFDDIIKTTTLIKIQKLIILINKINKTKFNGHGLVILINKINKTLFNRTDQSF